MSEKTLEFSSETYRIRGAIFEVYRELGSGFLESVYHECLACEFAERKIPFISQQIIQLRYHGKPIVQTFKADFVCFDKVILEIKAVKELVPEHFAQTFHYLKATGYALALLVNFGSHTDVTIERIIGSTSKTSR